MCCGRISSTRGSFLGGSNGNKRLRRGAGTEVEERVLGKWQGEPAINFNFNITSVHHTLVRICNIFLPIKAFLTFPQSPTIIVLPIPHLLPFPTPICPLPSQTPNPHYWILFTYPFPAPYTMHPPTTTLVIIGCGRAIFGLVKPWVISLLCHHQVCH